VNPRFQTSVAPIARFVRPVGDDNSKSRARRGVDEPQIIVTAVGLPNFDNRQPCHQVLKSAGSVLCPWSTVKHFNASVRHITVVDRASQITSLTTSWLTGKHKPNRNRAASLKWCEREPEQVLCGYSNSPTCAQVTRLWGSDLAWYVRVLVIFTTSLRVSLQACELPGDFVSLFANLDAKDMAFRARGFVYALLRVPMHQLCRSVR
jgi:hypothetical protein